MEIRRDRMGLFLVDFQNFAQICWVIFRWYNELMSKLESKVYSLFSLWFGSFSVQKKKVSIVVLIQIQWVQFFDFIFRAQIFIKISK